MMSKGHILVPHSSSVDLISICSPGFRGVETLHDLDLSGPDQLVQEQVPIDRRILEVMMTLKDGSVEPADVFFTRIMYETSTHIYWPSRMKFTYKSRRNPCVTIVGRKDAVLSAKSKVRCVFDTWSNRVTLKINVSHTQHSELIGIGGHNIKSLSVDTGCFIHFPDTNLKNAVKCNHISITGEMESVEKCREMIRDMTPVIFSFQVQIIDSGLDRKLLRYVQESYDVQVQVKPLFNPYFSQVLVKGSEWDLRQVKEATMVLIKQMCDGPAEQVPVYMRMEILPQHHPIVFGRHNEYLKSIALQTGADIRYFDSTDPNIPPNMRSNVVISGGIDNVYLARQQLIERQPLRVVFDVQKESLASNIDNIGNLANNLGVTIEMQHKSKSKNVVTVTIKGVEKNKSSIYEARQQLLGVKNAEKLAQLLVNSNVLNVNTVLTGKHPFSEDYCTPSDSKHMILSQYCHSYMLDQGLNNNLLEVSNQCINSQKMDYVDNHLEEIDSPTQQVQPTPTFLCVPTSWTYGFTPDSLVEEEEDKCEWSSTSSSDISTETPLTYAAVTKMRSTACSYSKAVGAERRKALKPVRTESGSFE